MTSLRDQDWAPKYDSDVGSLLRDFYVPALMSAVRYDRSTGFFSARALVLAARGIAGLVRNEGQMRLVIGCTLDQHHVDAIARGQELKKTVQAQLLANPLEAGDQQAIDALELLAWMVANSYLQVKVAVPCGEQGNPVAALGIFHEKAGVIEDADGNRIAFNGSINETASGWAGNWESFHVYTSWNGPDEHLEAEEESFQLLWSNKSRRAKVVDLPQAVADDLLKYLPNDDHPPRLLREGMVPIEPGERTHRQPEQVHEQPIPSPTLGIEELRRQVWAAINVAPRLANGGERVGEATANITPWPHQIKAFERMYHHWPPKLLIADEVGLGKTIEAGLLLRQAWLSGRAKRVLILAPKAVLGQWQVELREKFNLNWPIYDGQQLSWYPSPAMRNVLPKKVARSEWHKEPFVLTSSQLMRRTDRAAELLNEAEPYDLVVLDEAHHARRRGAGSPTEKGPNQLLRLMQSLRTRTEGLILMTATPMQVHPVEVWDLLALLGMPEEWSASAFMDFFDRASQLNPSTADFEYLAYLFRAVEDCFGPTTEEAALRFTPGSRLAAKSVLNALRDDAKTTRSRLSADRRASAVKLMRANTPVARLISRHTRGLLRRYFSEGKIDTPIPDRNVQDRFVEMDSGERDVYEAVEDYISTTYNRASAKERNAVGFVMTIYRRRVTSCFAALAHTLSRRLEGLGGEAGIDDQDDLGDDESVDETMDVDEVIRLKQEGALAEERVDIEILLRTLATLPIDTKATTLENEIQTLRSTGYDQVMVFTQFTDTMDFLRTHLLGLGLRVVCFSGRGGELPNNDGTWRVISRDEVKRVFRDHQADVLLATDAAAEGLNFQFCGAVINYDMPWNPMRVEQRIGRIDRLGQQHSTIQVINLHYKDTVEADVYLALRERIGLFNEYIGKLQPILAIMPRKLTGAVLARREDREGEQARILNELGAELQEAEMSPFDLDETTSGEAEFEPRPTAPLNLDLLDRLIRRAELLPAGDAASLKGNNEYEFIAPGLERVRVTTSAAYFEQHPASLELWSPGSPVFPKPDGTDEIRIDLQEASLEELLGALDR